jgi:hypothetical protein
VSITQPRGRYDKAREDGMLKWTSLLSQSSRPVMVNPGTSVQECTTQAKP